MRSVLKSFSEAVPFMRTAKSSQAQFFVHMEQGEDGCSGCTVWNVRILGD